MTDNRVPTRRAVRAMASALAVALLPLGACRAGGDDDRGAASGPGGGGRTVEAPPTSAPPAPSSTAPASTTTTTASPPTSPTTARRPGVASTTTTTEPFDAEGTARTIVESESAIRSAATPEAELAAHGRAAQAAYRRVVERPERLAAVLERVPPAMAAMVEDNVVAGRELRALTKPRTELPEWRIVPPPPAGELRAHYELAQARFGIPWRYLAAIHLVETRMGRIRGTSSAGAKGPMQFMPATWAAYGDGGDIEDPEDAILAAGRYLAASGAPGDMAKALYAYNHSQRYVRAVQLYAGQIEADERAYLGYYHWQVYVITTRGDVLLEEGYGAQ